MDTNVSRILIFGSRDYPNEEQVIDTLFDYAAEYPKATFIAGGSPGGGVDQWVRDFCQGNNIPYQGFPYTVVSEIDKDGKRLSVGQRLIRRNLMMVLYTKEDPYGFAHAFWTGLSPGTKNTIDHCDHKALRLFVSYPPADSTYEDEGKKFASLDREAKILTVETGILGELRTEDGYPKGLISEKDLVQALAKHGIEAKYTRFQLNVMTEDKRLLLIVSGKRERQYCLSPGTLQSRR